MLLVPTVFGPSAIHGTGLFAGRDIAAGETVTVWHPPQDVSCAPEALALLPPSARLLARHFGLVGPDGVYYLAAGDERYINHSRRPNLGGDLRRARVALRDICRGEEMTEDYRRSEPGLRAEWL